MIDFDTCEPITIMVAKGNRSEELSGFFSEDRFDIDPPKGYTRLGIRHSDDDDRDWLTLENHVAVNRAGWFFTKDNVNIPSGDDYLEIIDWNFE